MVGGKGTDYFKLWYAWQCRGVWGVQSVSVEPGLLQLQMMQCSSRYLKRWRRRA